MAGAVDEWRISEANSVSRIYNYDTYYGKEYSEWNYGDRLVRKSEMLHPDTLKPVDQQTLERLAHQHNPTSSNRNTLQGPVELRMDGSWSLGITMTNEGVVQSITEGTPASRPRLIFESRVRQDLILKHFCIYFTLKTQDGMWLAGKGKILPSDILVGVNGKKHEASGDIAYSLCHCTVGKTEVRYVSFLVVVQAKPSPLCHFHSRQALLLTPYQRLLRYGAGDVHRPCFTRSRHNAAVHRLAHRALPQLCPRTILPVPAKDVLFCSLLGALLWQQL